MFIPMGEPFSLYHTLTCGQAFRWQKRGEWFYGVLGKNVVMAREGDCGIEVNIYQKKAVLEDYFRTKDDFGAVVCELENDKILRKAMNKFLGLRILRQEPWECLVSFLCSIASNIPKISYTIENLASRFGERIDFEGEKFHAFPTCESLARAKIGDLRKCGVGFRAKYISAIAKVAEKEEIDFISLRKVPYGEARKKLISLPGIGEKVADCVCLFSLDKSEAFPIDRWIRRMICERYFGHEASDAQIRAFAAKKFGQHAGYAQQYLFSYARILSFKRK